MNKLTNKIRYEKKTYGVLNIFFKSNTNYKSTITNKTKYQQHEMIYNKNFKISLPFVIKVHHF